MIFAVTLCSLPEIPHSSFNVAVTLLATLSVFSSIEEGCPVVGNVTIAPYFLHLTMVFLCSMPYLCHARQGELSHAAVALGRLWNAL